MLLLNPGPVTLSERVRRSLLQPDLCHRESEFFDLQDEARMRLLSTYSLDSSQWAAVLMTASGTGAVESMVAALVPKSGRLLIVENGVYGERIAQICAVAAGTGVANANVTVTVTCTNQYTISAAVGTLQGTESHDVSRNFNVSASFPPQASPA